MLHQTRAHTIDLQLAKNSQFQLMRGPNTPSSVAHVMNGPTSEEFLRQNWWQGS